MSTFRIGGLGSGMDISSTITALLEADSQKVKAAQEEQSTRNERIGAWIEVKSALADFTKACDALRWMDVWRKMAPTSSNPQVVTATAASNAAKATYSLEVLQLARAQTIGSAAGLTTGGASPVAVTASTKLVDIDGIAVGNQFAIAGQTFTIGANDTLSTLRTQINEASASMPEDQRVSATILDNRLVLQRAATGDSPIVLSDVAGSPLQSLGVLDAVGQPSNVLLAAQNAVFSINGAVVERSSNTALTDVVEGVTLNLYDVGTSELTIASDVEGVKTAIQSFVDAYNAVSDILEKQGNYDTTDASNPVPGLLQNDYMIRDLSSQLRRVATQAPSSYTSANASYEYNGLSGIMNSLQSIGIWTAGKENQLSIVDPTRLDSLLDQEPEKVENLFRGIQSSTGTRSDGIALNLYNFSRSYSSDLDGWIDYRVEQIDDEIKRYDDEIDRMISAMEIKENMLWTQFNAMDEAIGEMNAGLDYLKSNLGLKDKS